MTKKEFAELLTELLKLAASYSTEFHAAVVNAFKPVAEKYGIDFNPATAKVDTPLAAPLPVQIFGKPVTPPPDADKTAPADKTFCFKVGAIYFTILYGPYDPIKIVERDELYVSFVELDIRTGEARYDIYGRPTSPTRAQLRRKANVEYIETAPYAQRLDSWNYDTTPNIYRASDTADKYVPALNPELADQTFRFEVGTVYPATARIRNVRISKGHDELIKIVSRTEKFVTIVTGINPETLEPDRFSAEQRVKVHTVTAAVDVCFQNKSVNITHEYIQLERGDRQYYASIPFTNPDNADK